jgi:hypothetical protein
VINKTRENSSWPPREAHGSRTPEPERRRGVIGRCLLSCRLARRESVEAQIWPVEDRVRGAVTLLYLRLSLVWSLDMTILTRTRYVRCDAMRYDTRRCDAVPWVVKARQEKGGHNGILVDRGRPNKQSIALIKTTTSIRPQRPTCVTT